MIELLFLASAMALPNFDAPRQPDAIPSSIRGAWDSSTADCANAHSVSRVHIGANWIGFYESGGVLQISTPAGIPDFEKSMAFRFVMAGEGSTWDNELVLGWNTEPANQLTWIEAKSKDNFDRDRERGQWVRCSN